MRLDLFNTRADAHVRKAQEYLQQASIARLEHQVAAEHHAALATMYTHRVAWLEAELVTRVAAANADMPWLGVISKPTEPVKRNSESVVALSWPQRVGSGPADAA